MDVSEPNFTVTIHLRSKEPPRICERVFIQEPIPIYIARMRSRDGFAWLLNDKYVPWSSIAFLEFTPALKSAPANGKPIRRLSGVDIGRI